MTYIGYRLLVDVLAEVGIDTVFGLPGSESVEVFDELRRRGVRTVLTTSEREAAFMAAGHFAASGRVAALCTIGGPGFTNALTGIAEAREDSTALLHLLITRRSAQPFGLHAMDHGAVARPIAKDFFTIEATNDLETTIRAAYAQATLGEPGPVIVELTREAITGYADSRATAAGSTGSSGDDWSTLADRLAASENPVLIIGQGAAEAAQPVTRLAEAMQCPVALTGSGRGILSDRHPLNMGASVGQEVPGEAIETILSESDLIVALGCKFTHNGSYGYRMALPPEKLARVDTAASVLGAGYPASITVRGDVRDVVEGILASTHGSGRKGWRAERLRELRAQADEERRRIAEADASLSTPNGHSPETVFAVLRTALPDDARVVTDSGLHQFLVRRHFEVRLPRTLLFPADFQSMGYGIPAAIGAQIAAPDCTTVAVIGDGGFAMTGFEMATAKREGLPIKVFVITNQTLELIREAQIEKRGTEHAVRILNPKLEMFAAAFNLPFAQWHDLDKLSLTELLAAPDPALVEIRLTGTRPGVISRLKGRARGIVEPRLRPGIATYLRRRGRPQ